ncbi:MAG: DUF934 domain-containing protein [Chromatiales bacterium]|jgi:uncharacterized protein (DUF934 family)|nr:MAG: DUF934 domain-containing protein [Chromatiales bacterium]
MGLIRDGRLVPDPFTDVSALEELPAGVALIVSFEQWQAHRDALLAGGQPLGLRLNSDQPPQLVATDLERLAVIALDFPRFRDGRAYTHARMLRERLGFTGEVRAVGDVLQEQLHFMQRCGFDTFEVQGPDPEQAWRTIAGDHTVWYQAANDARPRALDRRTSPDQ